MKVWQKNRQILRGILILTVLLLSGCGSSQSDGTAKVMSDEDYQKKAQTLAQKYLMLDGHIDIPYRLDQYMEDISVETDGGDFDYVRAKKGGLNAPFMSIYIPASYQKNGGAKAFADQLIDMVNGFQEKWPDKYAVATSVAEVHNQFKKGLISLPMGMENGAPVEGDLANLTHFYKRGIRYITLTHSKNNHICDSSYDNERKWNGLSPFGRQVVAEMNKLGIIIDVSHISDSTFYQVMRLSKAPVWASHSSARKYTPDWERNMSDDMIRLLAEKNGVICINFGSAFLRTEYQGGWEVAQLEMQKYMREHNIKEGSAEAAAYYQKYRKDRPKGNVQDVADHIDHVVKIGGIDCVALGSDYDGVLSLPSNLQDVSQYPNLIAELLRRGYSDSDIEKICGGNMLRVWSAVEAYAASQSAE